MMMILSDFPANAPTGALDVPEHDQEPDDEDVEDDAERDDARDHAHDALEHG